MDRNPPTHTVRSLDTAQNLKIGKRDIKYQLMFLILILESPKPLDQKDIIK